MADEDPSFDDLDLDGKKNILIQTLKNAYKKDHFGTFPIPFLKTKTYSVNKVYVDGGIELQNGTSPGLKRRKSGMLTSYKDLFSDNCFKNHINCIINGEPGHGKSTLFHQCVYDWCHENEESPLKQFELLIFLRLRQLSGVREISYAIKRFLLSKKTRFRTKDISNIIEKSSRPLLVILDGYDEYPDQDLEASYEMKTIIHGIKEGTCLPQHANIFLSGRYKPKTYDITNTTIVRLTGFDHATRIEYMEKCTSRDSKTSKEIHNRLTVNPLLDHICRTPLFFAMFAHMTFEIDDFEKWTSLTSFFRYIIKCFHSHLRNKEGNTNVQADSRTYDIEHSALNNLAMNGLIERKLVWKKSKIVEELGESFCNHYIKTGILREQVVLPEKNEVKDKCEVNTDKTEVYFLHKVICEWYAAISLSESISLGKSKNVLLLLKKLNPFDVHYVYRFACGINPTVATTLIPHVKNFSNELQIACILELRDSEDAARKSLRQFFETTLEIKGNENGIMRACKIELVRLASNHKIPIHTLRLNDLDYHVKPSEIQLEENVFLNHLPTVKELQVIVTDLINMTLEEFEHLMKYASHCDAIDQLVIKGFILPMYIPAKSIPEELKTKKFIVRWNVRNLKVYHILDMGTGMWQNGITNETLNTTDHAAMTNFIQNF